MPLLHLSRTAIFQAEIGELDSMLGHPPLSGLAEFHPERLSLIGNK